MSKSYRAEIEAWKTKAELFENYFEAYNILMEYWDFIPDEEKHEVHARLEKLEL